MYAVQKDVWHLTELDKIIVEQILKCSNNLFNVGICQSRQRYFSHKSAVKYLELYKITKTHENYGLLYSQVAQQALNSVAGAFSSFRSLENLPKKGQINQKPTLPKYRTQEGMYPVSHPRQTLKIVRNRVSLPLGTKQKEHFWTDSLRVPLPEQSKNCQIKGRKANPQKRQGWGNCTSTNL